MHVAKDTDRIGVVTTRLVFSKHKKKSLQRAYQILEEAREITGEDDDLGLGSCSSWLPDLWDGLLLDKEVAPLEGTYSLEIVRKL